MGEKVSQEEIAGADRVCPWATLTALIRTPKAIAPAVYHTLPDLGSYYQENSVLVITKCSAWHMKKLLT